MDDGIMRSCSTCKWNTVRDADPHSGCVTYMCEGDLHYALVNPELSVGVCMEWSPDTVTYLKITGYAGPAGYRYRRTLRISSYPAERGRTR